MMFELAMSELVYSMFMILMGMVVLVGMVVLMVMAVLVVMLVFLPTIDGS